MRTRSSVFSHRAGTRHDRPTLAALLVAVGAVACGTGGCAEEWRPARTGVQIAPAVMHFDISRRLPPPNSRAVYARTSNRPDGDAPQRYVVIRRNGVQAEGVLAEVAVSGLKTYFASPGDAPDDRSRFPWPRPQSQRAAGLLLRFDPPMQYLPQMLDAGRGYRDTVRVRIHHPAGKLLYTGSADRELRVEGYETVTAGGERYTDCVRVFAQTRIRVPWIARLTITEYLWLAPGKGFVRRVQRVAGWVFFRYFADVVEDTLLELDAPKDDGGDGASTHETPGAWSAAAFYFSPALPQPRLAGVVVEFAGTEFADDAE